jgi:hypothetical protein
MGSSQVSSNLQNCATHFTTIHPKLAIPFLDLELLDRISAGLTFCLLSSIIEKDFQ